MGVKVESKGHRDVNLFFDKGSGLLVKAEFIIKDIMGGADKEVLHYSTDFPNGGREVRDLNRNLQIDASDVIDPFTGIQIPDEDVTFSSMFILGADNPSTPTVAPELISNTLGEDLNNNGSLDGNEVDVIPNDRTLDRGILFTTTGPDTRDKVPFSFDLNDGGFFPIRHTLSVPTGVPAGTIWEYQRGTGR